MNCTDAHREALMNSHREAQRGDSRAPTAREPTAEQSPDVEPEDAPPRDRS